MPIALQFFPCLLSRCLLDGYQQAHHHCEEGNAFYQGGSDNHGGTDGRACLWLTCHAFHGSLANFTDTDTSTNRGETGTNGCACITPSEISSSL